MNYARYYTLKKLVEEVGLGWVQTNHFGKAGKAHFLEMRRKDLVQYAPGDSDRVEIGIGNRPFGPDRNALFYTITFKGLNLLLEMWPDFEEAHDAAHTLIKLAFKDDPGKENWDSFQYWLKELEYRAPKK